MQACMHVCIFFCVFLNSGSSPGEVCPVERSGSCYSGKNFCCGWCWKGPVKGKVRPCTIVCARAQTTYWWILLLFLWNSSLMTCWYFWAVSRTWQWRRCSCTAAEFLATTFTTDLCFSLAVQPGSARRLLQSSCHTVASKSCVATFPTAKYETRVEFYFNR